MSFTQIDSTFWTDPDFEDISALGRYLYLYLASNPYCNTIGMYSVTPKRICDDTGLERTKIDKYLGELHARGKIFWDGDRHLIWVKSKLDRNKSRHLDAYFKSIFAMVMALPLAPITKAFIKRYGSFLRGQKVGQSDKPRYTEADQKRLIAFLNEFECDSNDTPVTLERDSNPSSTSTLNSDPKDQNKDQEEVLRAEQLPHPLAKEFPLLQDQRVREVWAGFCAYRRRIDKKSWTPDAERFNLRDLSRFARGSPDRAVAVVEQSIKRGWKGIFELKEDSHGTNPQYRPDGREDLARQISAEFGL